MAQQRTAMALLLALVPMLLLSAQENAESWRMTGEAARRLESLQAEHVREFYNSGNVGGEVDSTSGLDFGGSARLRNAYVALRAWKRVIFSDPYNVTGTWKGVNVCNYTGVYCAPAVDDPCQYTVAGIDLNHADVAGFLPEQLVYLSDLAVLHLNSNRLCGRPPLSFAFASAFHSGPALPLLVELDLSNNRLVGPFPSHLLSLPSLAYLDLRFNEFEGALPASLFSSAPQLDAIFLNNNRFSGSIPADLGSSHASVIVLANNNFTGCLPPALATMTPSLNELLLLNNHLTGCITPSIGFFTHLTVLDVSFNSLSGVLPTTIGNMVDLEQLDVAHNLLVGLIPSQICLLPHLKNFTFAFNFFSGEPPICQTLPSQGVTLDDRANCLPGNVSQSNQRPSLECALNLNHTKSCETFACPSSTMMRSPRVRPFHTFKPAVSPPSRCIKRPWLPPPFKRASARPPPSPYKTHPASPHHYASRVPSPPIAPPLIRSPPPLAPPMIHSPTRHHTPSHHVPPFAPQHHHTNPLHHSPPSAPPQHHHTSFHHSPLLAPHQYNTLLHHSPPLVSHHHHVPLRHSPPSAPPQHHHTPFHHSPPLVPHHHHVPLQHSPPLVYPPPSMPHIIHPPPTSRHHLPLHHLPPSTHPLIHTPPSPHYMWHHPQSPPFYVPWISPKYHHHQASIPPPKAYPIHKSSLVTHPPSP